MPSLREIMAGVPALVEPKPRLVARSTALWWSSPTTAVIRLHRTDILTFHDITPAAWQEGDPALAASAVDVNPGGAKGAGAGRAAR